jgi:hypothetical protein
MRQRGGEQLVQSVGERLPVLVVSGPDRETLLKRDASIASARANAAHSCPRPLPPDAAVRLVQARALPQRATRRCATVEQRYGYKVRKAFPPSSVASVNARTACLPVRPMVLILGPVARSRRNR